MARRNRFSTLLQLIRQNHKKLAQHLDAEPARDIRTVGIVGAGTMGASIAAAALRAGKQVILCDRDAQVLEASKGHIDALLGGVDIVSARLHRELAHTPQTDVEQTGESLLKTGTGSEQEEPKSAEHVSSRGACPPFQQTDRRQLQLQSDLKKLCSCDLVIEAISESVETKHALYQSLAEYLNESAVLVTNTSAIPIDELAKGVPDSARFCGTHFLAPVRPGSLVEIVPGSSTSRSAISDVIAFAQDLGQTAVVVHDRTGFIANCMLSPYLDEGVALVSEGAPIERVDGAAEKFGIVVGPLRILDEVGLDTALSVGRVLWQAYPQRVTPSPVTIRMFKRGRVGRKSQAGFYRYASTIPWAEDATADTEINDIIAPWVRQRREVTDQEITDRLIFALLCEAVHLLEQEAADAPTIELISLVGLGFPAEHGGLLHWADSIGLAEVLRRLETCDWASRSTGIPGLLLSRARLGHPLAAG